MIIWVIIDGMDYLHRHIFRQEEVQIVHGHSAFSSLAHEALFVGSLMGLGTIFTDHSLFGFADASAIVTNTFLKYSLVNTRWEFESYWPTLMNSTKLCVCVVTASASVTPEKRIQCFVPEYPSRTSLSFPMRSTPPCLSRTTNDKDHRTKL